MDSSPNRYRFPLLAAVLSVAISGCAALTAPLSSSLEPGESVPSDKVLVIGKVVLDPPVEQGEIRGVIAARGTTAGVIKFMVSKDLETSINPNDMIPYMSPDEIWDMKYPGMSFLPMTPGVRYLRIGQYTTSTHGHQYNTAGSTTGGTLIVDSSYLWLFADIKITVPAGAKAVYIGTLDYSNDGTNATAVRVKDEYAAAMRQLAAMKIPGLTPRNVVKSLAVVVGKAKQRAP
jgi:hypothetical protein